MKKIFATAILVLLVASTANAQSANISATATVATALTVTAGNPLAFGSVFPTFTRTIDPLTSASAGSFTLGGQAGAQVALTFTLATVLTGPGTDITVTYNATAAAYGQTAVQASATAFNPATAGYLVNLSPTGPGYVWIGGAITPPGGQVAGAYSGTITLAAAYTGS